MTEQILIACIGNIFFGDDGFGVEVARALASTCLPKGIEVRDYGIRGLDLTYALLEPWKAVIFVDAVSRGAAPGTLYTLQPRDREGATASAGLDPHALNPVQVLAAARSLGRVTAEIYIVACEPRDLGDEVEGRMGLSPEVTAAIPEAVRMVKGLALDLLRMERVGTEV
jgi:hydrogenase maturation protease